jgi:hypothetical protein
VIEQLCLGGRTALLVQPLYDDLPILVTSADIEAVADFHILGWFSGGSIQLYLATIHGVACQAASLEEAGCPKPFIKAHWSKPLSPETPILIPVDYSEKLVDRCDRGVWLIALPLQTAAHPEYLPAILGPDVSGLGEGAPMDDRGIVPLRADFEKLDTLADHCVAEVEFFADMERRTSLGQELVQGILDPLFLKVVEGHQLNCQQR